MRTHSVLYASYLQWQDHSGEDQRRVHPADKPGPVTKHDFNPASPSNEAASPPLTRGSDKYQRILDAAVAVFAEKGFFTSRIADIADRADVADGTVYLYFKNKEEILMTAINTAFDAFMGLARTELKKFPDPAERLRRLAFLHLDALGSNRNLAVVFQMELRQSTRFLSEFSHHHMIEYLDLVRDAIREAQAIGLFRRETSDKIAANCFFGALDEMVTSWVLSENDYPLSNVAGVVVDIFLNGMRTAQQP
jgi:TetR/AcrR family fatty acid metabolism transcriptional regulator